MVYQRTVDLLRYLPPYLQEYVEFYHLMLAENPEFEFIASNCKNILNNTFIMYCDEQGIQRFERLLNIVASEDDTLEFRKSKVMVRWNDTVPYTLKALTNKLVAMQGNDDIQIILNGYSIIVITHMDNKGQADSIWDLFNTMIPCNMDVTHKNLVRCNSGGLIFIAAGTNYSRLTCNEYTQYFNSSGTFYIASGMNYARTVSNHFVQHFNSSGVVNLGVGISVGKISVNEYVQEFTSSGSVTIGSGISYAQMSVNEYVQEFSSQGNVYIASGLNHGQIAVNEYTQQFTTSGKIYLATGMSNVRMAVNDYTQVFSSEGSTKIGVGISNTEKIKIY